jgi:hypothetical protein
MMSMGFVLFPVEQRAIFTNNWHIDHAIPEGTPIASPTWLQPGRRRTAASAMRLSFRRLSSVMGIPEQLAQVQEKVPVVGGASNGPMVWSFGV